MRLIKEGVEPALLAQWMDQWQVPGVSYCLIKEGQAGEPFALGTKKAGSDQPVTADTVFEAASLTKSLFAVLVLRLVDRGLFTLDEPIALRAPSIRVTEDDRVEQITIRHMLSHGTGLPNWAAKPLTFLFDPGKGFSYSGEGYYYLQHIVEALTGRSFVELMEEELLKPLGMKDSAAVWNPDIWRKMSHKHDEQGRVLPLREGLDLEGNAPEPNAAWSLYSGAADFPAFLLELLHHRAHLSPALFEAMSSPQNQADAHIAWGLGFGIAKKAPDMLWHWGDNGGYRSFACIDLASGDGGCLFCNGQQGTDLCLHFFDQVTDGTFWGEIGSFLETAE